MGSITNTYPQLSGSAAIDPARNYFVIDNAVNGFGLHKMEDGVCIRTYDTNPTKTYPKQVAFAEGGTLVIGGSDDGFVHVFDRATSERVQTLRHSGVGRVQTIAVRT